MAASALLAGCGSSPADLFAPDWDEVTADRGMRDELPERSTPEPEIEGRPLASAATPAFAPGEPLELSVEQAVFVALQQSRDLRVAQFEPAITGAFELIERGRFDPELFANAEFTRVEALETARATREQFGVVADDSLINAGVRGELPTGTDIELGVEQRRDISNRAPEQQQSRLGLTVTQSLLRGFGPAVNLAQVRQAEIDTAASRFILRGFVESLVADTEIAYWNYRLAQREIAIFERSLEVAERQRDQTLERIEVGVLPRTEAAAARSEVALRQQALIDARSDFAAARLDLLRLMNIPLDADGPGPIDANSAPAADERDDGELAERIRLAQTLRPDLNEARLRLEQDRLETIRTRNGILPRLDVFVALGKTGFADTFDGSFQELDGPTYDYTVGIEFLQSLGNRSARGAYRAALASRAQAAAAVENLGQLVELDVRLAANDAHRARQQIDATAVTRRLQEETARAEQERFDVGSSTALLVAQAQRDLLEAQIAEVEAVIDYRIALVRLYLAEGSLLERRGVTLPPAD